MVCGFRNIRHLPVRLFPRVHLGQRQELLRHAGQSVCLVADVLHKFPDGASVHVVLQNGIRQQLDGGQRRFQFMRSIRNKLPPALLRGLEPLGQGVEFAGKHRQLVMPPQLHFVGVISLPDDADGGKNLPHTSGKRL